MSTSSFVWVLKKICRDCIISLHRGGGCNLEQSIGIVQIGLSSCSSAGMSKGGIEEEEVVVDDVTGCCVGSGSD